VKQLTRLIDDLLDVARITQGKIQLRKEFFDPTTVIHQAVEAVRPLVEKKRHQISLSITSRRMTLEGDPTRLEQILINLLANAAKYSEDGGRIWLSAEPEAAELVIKVKDAGIGISPEKLPEMFELFAQADRSLAHSEGGLGIGLALVRKLTELHGGSVTAASEGPGKGSEFTVRLPAAAELPTKVPKPQKSSMPVVSSTARVLIVDDNQDTASGMAKLLKVLGHEAAIANDGPAAIEAAQEFQPSYVLLDIGLPGMDGYQVARRLRQHESCKDSVIIAVSGYGQDEDRRRAKEAGIDHHLVKPIDHNALITLLTGSRHGA
jgi:CheY-like chemotaxis protein